MSRRPAILLAVAALLLALAGFAAYLLEHFETRDAVPDAGPFGRESVSPPRPELEVEEPRVAVAPPLEPAPAAPPEDLRAEGARRGWRLPVGKGWWMDTLINPTGVDPEGAEIERLQENVLGWCDQLLALEQAREKRLVDYCQERIAAGLAVEDDSHEFLSDGKEHRWITVRTPRQPDRKLRVDIGAGDDGELDRLDRQVGTTWSAAVLDLRRRFAALKR